MENTEQKDSKKTSIIKKMFIGLGIVLALLGVNHLTLKVGYDAEVTLTDSTIVLTHSVDTLVAIADTTKKDTTHK